MDAHTQAQAYLDISAQFRLGALTTEQPHPLTHNLSDLAQNNLPQAIDCLKQIDAEALETLKKQCSRIEILSNTIQDTLKRGHSIFICGCGATGRLALSLEIFCREGLVEPCYQERIISFMAGGDAALIRSIENFEDYPEYGARQLSELGFQEGDLLISATEGGETPFVIGATEHACKLSDRAPWFLYCNPDEELCSIVERSQRVIENSKIKKLNLTTGPMGVAGSTRMQASTILMLVIGLAFNNLNTPSNIAVDLENLIQEFHQIDFQFLTEFIKAETQYYQNQEYVLYSTDVFGVTVLTDTTERSPTFSLPIFENVNYPDQPPSLCYLCLPQAQNAKSAWQLLLHRSPRTLEWDGLNAPTKLIDLLGYDISNNAHLHRKMKLAEKKNHLFRIEHGSTPASIYFQLEAHSHELFISNKKQLFQHTLLKMILNIHSTLIMGRLKRYEGNLMTYVKPSNNKLIDRSIRYVQILYEKQFQCTVDYSTVALELFKQRKYLSHDASIVFKTLQALNRHRS